jgi:phage gp36-like protein
VPISRWIVAYADSSKLLGRVPQHILDALLVGLNPGDPDPRDWACRVASSELDSYFVTAGHTVPLDPVPDVVEEKCLEIAVYRLHARQGAVDDRLRDDYKDAIAWAEKVAKKVVSLAIPSAAPPPTSESPDYYCDADRTFSAALLGQYR